MTKVRVIALHMYLENQNAISFKNKTKMKLITKTGFQKNFLDLTTLPKWSIFCAIL